MKVVVSECTHCKKAKDLQKSDEKRMDKDIKVMQGISGMLMCWNCGHFEHTCTIKDLTEKEIDILEGRTDPETILLSQ